CALQVLLLTPLLWRRMWSLAGLALGLIIGLAAVGHQAWFDATFATVHWPSISIQMAILALGGLSVLALPVTGGRNFLQPDLALLFAWLLGTFAFAAFVNWTVNARSILPLIPAAAILLTRRLELCGTLATRRGTWAAASALGICSIVGLWMTLADARLADAG